MKMHAEITLRISLVKGKRISLLWVSLGSDIMVIATTTTERGLEGVIRTAFLRLVEGFNEDYGLDSLEALMLYSQLGQITIGNLLAAAT